MTQAPIPDGSANRPVPRPIPAASDGLGDYDYDPANPSDGDDDSDGIRSCTRHVNRHRADLNDARDAHRHVGDGGRHGDEGLPVGTHHRDHDSAPRDQIRRLLAGGGTYRSIAAAAGLSPTTVHDIAAGRQAPTPHTARALAAITSASLRHVRVDAGGTRLRLRALHVMGHGSARIARALGARDMTVRAITRGDAPTVSATLRDDIADLYDAWWDKRAPERTRSERTAATAARRRAIAGNWCPGAGLVDDELDTPGYRPTANWKPASGTGTAPDIQPQDRPRRNRNAGQPLDQPTTPTSLTATQPSTAEGRRPWH